jgi:hypothetical protein
MVIKIRNAVAENNGGAGFQFDGNAEIEAQNLRAVGNRGDGIVVTIPNTPVKLSEDDLEKAKEILESTPETSWSERLQTLKSVADLGAAAAQYIPAIINFVRAHFGL